MNTILPSWKEESLTWQRFSRIAGILNGSNSRMKQLRPTIGADIWPVMNNRRFYLKSVEQLKEKAM
ncbi:hypothetical protein D1872_307550 [compost metagenome]